MAKLAILGHATRGKEVIEILEMLGGNNKRNLRGIDTNLTYYICSEGNIDTLYAVSSENFIVFTLEEFLEKYPYKVGDSVNSKYLKNYKIEKAEWDSHSNKVVYKLQGVGWFSVEDLQPYEEAPMYLNEKANKQSEEIKKTIEPVKEIMEEMKLDIPDGYEFFGIDDDGKIVLTKKQPRYPKTYGECCKIITAKYDTHYFYTKKDKEEYPNEVKLLDCLDNLRKLLICRDAYWKIADEQMGLGKPWEPNWEDESEDKYTIVLHDNKNCYANCKGTCSFLTFPTAEMRDTFYENFKDLIEECKMFL